LLAVAGRVSMPRGDQVKGEAAEAVDEGRPLTGLSTAPFTPKASKAFTARIRFTRGHVCTRRGERGSASQLRERSRGVSRCHVCMQRKRIGGRELLLAPAVDLC
jgi:hypothetical protein